MDPRDKVYGLLGLVHEYERLEVDYNKSVPEVYVHALRELSQSIDRGSYSTPRTALDRFTELAGTLARNLQFSDHQINGMSYLFAQLVPAIGPYPAWFFGFMNSRQSYLHYLLRVDDQQ
jgi:hypothetical protein